jgi:hypothetical protein
MSTRAKVRETARAQATRSGRVPQSAIDAELKAFDDKDLRLRSVAPNVRQREAKRRLTDIDGCGGGDRDNDIPPLVHVTTRVRRRCELATTQLHACMSSRTLVSAKWRQKCRMRVAPSRPPHAPLALALLVPAAVAPGTLSVSGCRLASVDKIMYLGSAS